MLLLGVDCGLNILGLLRVTQYTIYAWIFVVVQFFQTVKSMLKLNLGIEGIRIWQTFQINFVLALSKLHLLKADVKRNIKGQTFKNFQRCLKLNSSSVSWCDKSHVVGPNKDFSLKMFFSTFKHCIFWSQNVSFPHF